MNMNFEISSPSTMLVNGSSDNQQSLTELSSLSSSSSSLFSSSSSYSPINTSGNCFTLEAHLPLVTNKVEHLEKFKRLLTRLDNVYNHNQKMSATTLPPPSASSSASHVTDRYLFRSLSNDNQNSRRSSTTTAGARKNKLSTNPNSSTPPSLKKRYKFSPVATDQNNNDVYKFPNGQTEQRSHSTDSDRYYFPLDSSSKTPQQTLTYVRSGTGLEQRAVTFIDGTSATTDKISSPTTKSIQPTTLIPDTPYLFTKTTESKRQPSATSSVNPEDTWIHQRQQPNIIYDSHTDSSSTSHAKRPRTSSMSPEHRHLSKQSPTRMDTVTSTNGSLSTIRRSSPNKIQNVRFDSPSTQGSYLAAAHERLIKRQRGRSPQALNQSVDRLVSSTNQKYRQQQLLSPPVPFQQHQRHHDYISQYYAQEEPPIDYPMDSDDDDEQQQQQQKRSIPYTHGSSTNGTHSRILKTVNGSLLDRNYLSEINRIKRLEQNAHRYLRLIENQSLQRELNHDLIRCFSSTYLDDLRREENRNIQTRINMRPYTYEDIQDIHMSQVLEAYKMKRAIDREKRLRLSTSFDGQITSSTPTSSIGAGHLSPLLSSYSPLMTGSFNENFDVQSGGFETDRRSQKSHTPISQTPTNLRTSYVAPGPNMDPFYGIMQDSFRGVDASIAGHVSNASQYTKQKAHHPSATTSQTKSLNHSIDMEIPSFSSDDDEEQMIVDNQRKTIPNQKQLSRYLSTVNRSLLDRPSDLISDFYISNLNRSMQDSVRQVETIARDKAIMREHRNREFIDETSNKLGRSLSAEHLYQVRKEHLRYKQPFTAPTSFTAEDVADIYKPFVLENYKRKIAIELERRRRERQGQLMAGFVSPPMQTSDPGLSNVIKLSQPPIIELPINTIGDRRHRPSNLTQSSILRTNEPGVQSSHRDQQNDFTVLRPTVVQSEEIRMGRARRTLTDDGNADVVHHIGIVSPPLQYSIVKRPSTNIRSTVTTSTSDQYEIPRVTTVAPPDFVDRNQVYIREERIQSHTIQSPYDGLVDSAVSTSQQVLFKDDDYDPNLRRPVQIITTTVSPHRPQTKIYTPSPPMEPIRICQADRVESASGNYDLSMANIQPILTLNQGEIRELNLLAQQAQRLQIPSQDYDHAMIILTPEHTSHQHGISQQPLLLAAANIAQLRDETNEQVTRHFEQEIQRQHTQLITPVPEHMAKVEHDISVFENVTTTHPIPATRNKLNEIPFDSGIVSLNTSQASEQPLILNASRIHRLESSDEQQLLENLHEDDYYRRRIRAFDLLRQVETDPNTNIQPIHNSQIQIFENITPIPPTNIPREHMQMIGSNRLDRIQTLEHTDEPVVYETIEQDIIRRIPPQEHLTSLDVQQDNQMYNRAEQIPIQWRQNSAIKPQHQSTQNQLIDTVYEQTRSFSQDPRETLRPVEETTQHLETLKHPDQEFIYGYGQKNEIPVSRTSSFGSDHDLKAQTQNSARLEYGHKNLSSLDDITQPISHHPPARTHHDQEQTTMDIDQEPMAVREETALENEVSYYGSLGRASLNQPIQQLNAPRTLAHSTIPALLLEELTIAADEQQAISLIHTDHQQNMLEKIEQSNRIPIIVYDTDWKDEHVQSIPNAISPSIQNAQHQSPSTIEYEQAQITSPSSILARERYEHLEDNNQESTEQIDMKAIPDEHLNELISIHSNSEESYDDSLQSEPSPHEQEIFCRPLADHLLMNDEHVSSLSDDSFLLRHQQQSNIEFHETTTLENPLRSTAFLTLNYPHQNQESNPSWQNVSEQQFINEQQNLPLQTEHVSPRYLPSISSAASEQDHYANEFHHIPIPHEYVDVQNSDRIHLTSATQINQSRPVYRVQQQQLPSIDEHDYSTISSLHPDHIDRIDTAHTNMPLIDTLQIEAPPTIIDIEMRVRPAYSETSSLPDMETCLNRLEDSFEPEQHLPLIDQISLSYTSSLRSSHDRTQRAIERYEQEHPYFSRALPTEWLTSTILPHDEQLVEQWTVERNLETIQQQVELRTNTECVSVLATATDAYPIDERFEEEKSNSLTTNNEQQINQIVSTIITSHCSPTSDYETDSLDKDNDTTSTTPNIDSDHLLATTTMKNTLPSQLSDPIPIDDLLETFVKEQKNQNDLPPKDLLFSISLNQDEIKNKPAIHLAKENELEQDDHSLLLDFDENQRELLAIFFEPAHFHLPLINEISIYQMTFSNEFSSLNLSLPMILNDENLSSNEYKTIEQDIFSVAQINYQSDLEEDLESISYKYEQPSYIEHYHIQSLYPFSETLFVHIDEPPAIIEPEEDQSTSSILPDVIPSATTVPDEDFIRHDAKEVTILPSDHSTEFLHSTLNRTQKARQSKESYNLERLPEQKYVEINVATPTPSMRKVRPTHSGSFIEDLSMENTVDARTNQHDRYRYTDERDNLNFATTSQEPSDSLQPRHLPVEHVPDSQRARVISSAIVPSHDLNKNDEVLIRDTVVQHISEDEKSTSSEEVVFEEWSEEFRCRRIDEFDRNTNRLLRTTIDETSARVKSDVIKEEYREKNERIKGHKSYDVVKEVYRRVPAHTIDPKKLSTVSSIDQSHSHVYEEVPQPPPSNIRRTPSPTIERIPRDRHWSSEDIYTTEIVYDPRIAHDIESSAHVERSGTKLDSTTLPPSSSANYDRVRPGQYPPIPSSNQAVISTVPSSTYDRISNIVTPSTHFSERRPQEREEVISEEYQVEFEQRHSDRHSPFNQRGTSTFGTRQQRDETSEEDVSDAYVTGGDGAYHGLTTIVNEAGQRRDSDWRQKLKEVYSPTSDDDRFDESARSRDISKKFISTTRSDEDRPQPPKRSSSSSSIIDERRARFEQQQSDSSSGFPTNQTDRPTVGRVGELKNAFESSTNGSTKDDMSKYRTPISTGLTEQRRRMFEEQEQVNKEWASTSRRPIDDVQSNERRMSETHTAPSRVTERISRIESSTTKPQDSPRTTIDITIKDKRTGSSVDSDLSGASPPIYQSTPKSTKQKHDDDAGHESEDELSDPINRQGQFSDGRRRTSKTRLRDFSQSTSQPIDTSYLSQRTKSSFNETNMENILSHVPTSKGKGLLIELSPHISQESPTTKPIRDPHKSIGGSDSGIFEYSTATSQQPQIGSLSWRDDTNRSQTIRDSGVYVDASGGQRYGRRQTSDTDQTTTHVGDDSVSRSTYRYETEILPTDKTNQQQQQQQRNIHRHTTGSPPSDYENISNFHSGLSSQRKVPITTQSRSIITKPYVVDEIETIETETRVECQVQRTHEIKESTTKTERTGSPHAPKKIITTTTTTTTTTAVPPPIRSSESSSDEAIRTTTPSKRVLLNERPQYYDSTKSHDSPIAIRSRPESTYTPPNETRQQTQTYRESGIHQHRFDSPPSEIVSYPVPVSTQEDEGGRVEETWFKPIQRDRSQDSLRQSPSSRSNMRTLSAGPRTLEVTSLSPESQVTFGKYSPNQIIAIVRVPGLSSGTEARPSLPPNTIRHGTSEPELYARARQEEEEQQRAKLHYQRIHATSYRPPLPTSQDYQQRQSRSRTGPLESTNEYPSPLGTHTRSSSYHSALHEQERQQQQDQDTYSPNSGSTYQRQIQRRSGSLGNLFGSNIEFEIEIEKRPPQQPAQPTVVALDQPTRAIVTTSKDGRVSIQNVAARPGNTVVINSDFHSSDRSLNRSSGYFSSDELRSQGLNTNYSSDEQSSGAGIHAHQQSQSSNIPSSSHPRRYRNNDQTISKLPAHYRPKQPSNYQQLNSDGFDKVNRLVNRYSQHSNGSTGFNETIDQIDALYNNLDVQTPDDYLHDHSASTYDFSKPPPTATNRRKHLSQDTTEYTKRYSSTGFQHVPPQYEPETGTTNPALRHLVSPPVTSNNDKKRHNTHRAFSDNENLNNIDEHNRRWGSSSLNDLVMATPLRPSQSLSSSGILADYGTPGSISPNSGFGSTQNVILQQNRLNGQSQIVQRNRTSVKQVKQKSAAKKKSGNIQGQYTDEEDDNDSAGGHDSPISDTGRPQPPTRFSNRHQ